MGTFTVSGVDHETGDELSLSVIEEMESITTSPDTNAFTSEPLNGELCADESLFDKKKEENIDTSIRTITNVKSSLLRKTHIAIRTAKTSLCKTRLVLF
jgi:hypothetical protein